jgi:hypothetical protein
MVILPKTSDNYDKLVKLYILDMLREKTLKKIAT